MSSSSKYRDGMSKAEYYNSLQIPLRDIELATNNFADENLLKQSSSCKVYKGKLLHQSEGLINIIACKYVKNNKVLDNEVHLSRIIIHKNIVSIFKIVVIEIDEDGITIINRHEANGNLKKHLSGPTLNWMRRLQICVGVADALKYLHYDALDLDHVIHGNIKCSKILLDHNWEPKIYGFGSAFIAKKHRLHLTRNYNCTLQYRDPTYENTRGLTHKSDVFSFGVLLFEVLFGREAFIQDNDNWYFARLARSHYEDRKLDDLIDPDLRKQMDLQSLKIFAETAYGCIKEQWLQRLDMKQVHSKLEEALKLQHKFENPKATSSSNDLKGKSYEHLKFRLHDIEFATNKFSDKYKIGSGGFGVVYKGELKHLDEINSPAIEGKTKAKISNKVSTVAIKRIFSRNDVQGEQGFISEIEMLSNCKHPNVVTLHGFCDEGEEMLLIYEYVSNGSLSDYLENSNNMTNLTWAQRVQICLDIAQGLKYLHTSTKDKQSIIHRDIKSANILLDHNWMAKIADFGLSKLNPTNQRGSTLVTKNIAGTEVYLDPEYIRTGKLKAKSDVYSFGVILFEIMCGKLAYDRTYGQTGLPTIARQCFNDGTLKTLVDPKIKEAGKIISMLIGAVDEDSFTTFTKVAYQCLAETQLERPTIEIVIEELQNALNFQINNKERLVISLEAIKLGTKNFNDSNCIGERRFWKLYEGEVVDANRRTAIIAKRWDRESSEGHSQFLRELDILYHYKHESIIGLVGYCYEMGENIIVYEHASNGRLDKHLGDPSLTWMKRLKICIDVVSGLEFLHKGGANENGCVIHRDIKSRSILLDGDWNAKIANFELSCNNNLRERAKHVDDNACDSLGYIDPEYQINGFLTTYSDIYSFGVILIEMLSGRLACAERCEDDSQLLGHLTLKHYAEKKSLDEMIFEGIKGQILSKSLTEFANTTIRCLKHHQCTKASEVVKHAKKALVFQKFPDDDNLCISFEAIKLGTRNFSDDNCIGEGRFWKLYKGEIVNAKGCTTIIAKRWDTKSSQGHQRLQTELHILLHYKHENVIGLVGYCIEMDENIIVYEHAHNGRLDKKLYDPSLTWMKRLKICLDVAYGLVFLHKERFSDDECMTHRDIKSGSILLDDDWNAKISNFEFSCKTLVDNKVEHLDDYCSHSMGYADPRYYIDGCFRTASDIYSFGVILIEILSGRLAWEEECKDQSQSLGPLALRHYNEKGSLDEIIFEGIKQQISPQSLTTFQTIAIGCLHDDRWDYPVFARGLVMHLEEALKFQEDHETWEPRLPTDYKEIIRGSRTPMIFNSVHMKEDIHAMLSKGVLVHYDKTFLSLGSHGEINELISARMFSYQNRNSRKSRSVQESRFGKVAQMLDISKLQIKIKITTGFLSPGVNYGAYLIFKFCDLRKISSKPMYVNLKYKMGGENLNAYFATWKDNKWMAIELCRFFSHKKDTDFEALLESFSQYHCGNGSIYVEGIEFRVIDNVQNKDIEQFQQFQKSNSNKDHNMQLLSLNEVNRKEHLMLSATEVLYDSSNVKHFHLHPSAESRFQEVVELLPQHVFRIKCKIESKTLSHDTEYLCYLVFKLSEKCIGLHCPVIVRAPCKRNKKKAEIVYFRSPSPWNLHENNSVPKQREDGWMEVKVSKFNSGNQLRNGCIQVNLKLITYDGTMSGLIVCGMEFRPM